MQGIQFLFVLENIAGQSASFVDNTLIWNSTLTPLELSPDAYQELSIMTERNKSYFAVDITYGTPQNFVKQSAAILQTIAYMKGIEEVVYLRILEQQLWFTDTEYGYYYDQIVKCELDMGAYVDSGEVNVTMEDGDVVKYLRANESIDYAIDLDVPGRNPILMDGTKILQSASFITQDPLDFTTQVIGSHIIPLSMISYEQKQQVGAKSTVHKVRDVDADIFATDDNVLTISGQSTVTIISDFGITPIIILDPAGTLYKYVAKVFNRAGQKTQEVVLFQTALGAGSGRHVIKQTNTLTVDDGSRIYLMSMTNKPNSGAGSSVIFKYDSTDTASGVANVVLQYTFRPDQTVVYGFTMKQIFEKLVDKITNGQYGVKSTLFDNPDINVMLTCADAIRRLQGAQIKISLKKFFALSNLIYGVGMGNVGGTLTIERKRVWVSPDDPGIDIGEMGSRPKIRPATDLMFSSISVGWPNVNAADNTDVNGRFEFNVTQVYNTPITRVSTKLDLTTTVRADASGVVTTSLNLDGKTTTSSNTDNDVFALHVEKTITSFPNRIGNTFVTRAFKLDRSINQYILDNNIYVNAGDTYNGQVVDQSQYVQVGVIDKDSAFNVALSPKQCLVRAHGDYIRSCVERSDNKFLTFSKSDKNSALTINSPTYPTVENGDVQLSTLDQPIFRPWIIEGPVVNPNNLSISITKNPVRKYFSSFKGIPFSGTSQKSAIIPWSNASQSYQLLLSPGVDLSPFITVYE